jgi:protein-L-isoaspartate(D-aspartate) O-methyltransferase
MVRRQIARRGVTNRRVQSVMGWVPRELFVPDAFSHLAYEDAPLPLSDGQTVSQPYIVALMTDLAQLNRHSRVLEVGTGSGYHTAILAKCAAHVWSIERLGHLIPAARRRLEQLHIRNCTLIAGNGTHGFEDAAPYDAIIVAAATDTAPTELLGQLAVGGHLVIPLGDQHNQDLTVVERTAHGYRTMSSCPCRFVPLVFQEHGTDQ